MPVVSFKITDEELAVLQKVVEAQGVSSGIFCRSLLLRQVGVLAATPAVVRRVANRDELRLLLGELGRHGSLLNQIARRLNGGGTASVAFTDLATMRVSYEAALIALTTTLGVTRTP